MIAKSLILAALGMGLMNAPSNVSATENGLFGTTEIPSRNLDALPQWKRVISSFPELEKAAAECDRDILRCGSQQMTLWRTKIQELEHASLNQKVREVNRFINKWQIAKDQDLYKQADHWAAPLDFLPNGGDSEDFAIMKYVSLKELGVKPENMRLVVTNDVLRGQTHTILGLTAAGKTYILDSQNDSVLEEGLVKYYVPFYSANETTRWAHIPGHLARQGNVGGNK
ncbi:hypothetical protein GUA87_14780 [Sneathiella sp. P13V-1]|uniref:transglutaminase-like cysteine peptidase n=1 Tax=Sneathiella sp. P13V-1 TaxID=2697366 RepID=UPI00187BB837|nr:transglutaminase-like cysteine peptidase [Sneathiella sp. P13V-1]MBE7638120.1 hypothetical protein [Sneathiella sp. P13V-1]